VIKNRAGEHESVKQGDGDADRNALFQLPEHAAGGGAVNVKAVVLTSEGRRNDERLAFDEKADMAEKPSSRMRYAASRS